MWLPAYEQHFRYLLACSVRASGEPRDVLDLACAAGKSSQARSQPVIAALGLLDA